MAPELKTLEVKPQLKMPDAPSGGDFIAGGAKGALRLGLVGAIGLAAVGAAAGFGISYLDAGATVANYVGEVLNGMKLNAVGGYLTTAASAAGGASLGTALAATGAAISAAVGLALGSSGGFVGGLMMTKQKYMESAIPVVIEQHEAQAFNVAAKMQRGIDVQLLNSVEEKPENKWQKTEDARRALAKAQAPEVAARG